MKEISTFALPSHLTDIPEREAKAKNVIGKDDFMKLLMVQMQHQDPLKPMDHEQFSAQLAQFSSLEQLTNIGKGIDKLHGGMGEEQKLAAIGMIGRKVTASGNEVSLMEGQAVALNYSMPENVRPLKATIQDSGGNVVREIELGAQDARAGIVWDGKGQEGANLPSGKYSFRISGVDQNGTPQDADAALSGVVTGVELDGKTAMLVVNNGQGSSRIEMSKIHQVAVNQPVETGMPISRPMGPPGMKPMAANAAPAAENQETAEPAEVEGSASEDWSEYPQTADNSFRSGGLPVANPMESFRP